MRRLDIGIASYRAPDKLRLTLASLMRHSTTAWRIFVIHNPSPDDAETRAVIEWGVGQNTGITPIYLPENVGYAGAVNKLMEVAETEYIAYLDNDAIVASNSWDEILCSYLDRFHEIGIVFPNEGPYAIDRGPYTEVMWGVGFCWVLNRLAMKDTGPFDTEIGHQEEADYCMRLRMAGYRCAVAREVHVEHAAVASTDPASIERINRGIVNWVNKWNRYFNGKNFNYHSPNVTRWEDWPPNALYMEEFWRLRYPELNANPEVITDAGREYDLIKVPRFKGFYRSRII